MALTTQQKLDEARAAYHSLLIGTSAKVVVDSNGERLEFTAANRSALLQYINDLEALLCGKTSSNRRPVKVWFK